MASASEQFTALVTPPAEQSGPALWFAFQGAQILVLRDTQCASLPSARDMHELGISPRRSQYLGVLGKQHCFACELDEGCAPP
ncbi:MAG: NADH pyrophosphatase, partial [Betaproteobacteria bacterium]